MRRRIVFSRERVAGSLEARLAFAPGHAKRGSSFLAGNLMGVPNGISIIALVFAVIFLIPSNIRAQQATRGESSVVELGAVVNFKELARREAAAPVKAVHKVIPFLHGPGAHAVPAGIAGPEINKTAPLAPTPSGAALLPSPSSGSSFIALSDNGTSIPPDTQGAAGPNNLMVTLNTEVRIQDKSGAELSRVSLDSFWGSLSGVSVVFDPRLSYDPYRDRWIFVAASNQESTSSKLLVGVSQSSDPTGSWNLYKTTVDGTGVGWGDYPSMGFNKDWVVVDLNLFNVSDNQYDTAKIYAFSKADLYDGLVSVRLTTFTEFEAFSEAPAATYDNTLDTMYMVQSWNGNASGNGFLRISSISGAVGSEDYTAQVAFASTPNPWDPSPLNGVDFAPQMGSAQLIQNGDDRVINVVYRNGYLWAAQNAFLPSTGSPIRTAAQWWQLATDGTVRQFGRVDDSTGTVFYAYPSIAVNANDDAVLGYSRFSANQFAGANYSVRLAGDPLNTMRSDTVLKAGEASYFKTFGPSGSENRWGDYSNTVVDPSNDMDIWTIQEYAATPTGGSDRWGTWWGRINLKRRHGQVISE
jgi:hypothetical protein